MAVAYANFLYSKKIGNNKRCFVPSQRCKDIGEEVTKLIRERVTFEPHFYHFSKGAHVAALHEHRAHHYFARLDLKNFFYSIGRNRVKATLKEIGVPKAEHFAKWSTVPNPYEGPRFALPYGFVQSPILATLVLRQSPIGVAIHHLPANIQRSIYLDDISVSSDSLGDLEDAFAAIMQAVEAANLTLNEAKLNAPAAAITLFNCDLSLGRTEVTDARIAEFYEVDHSDQSTAGFEGYRATVSAGNS